MASASPASIQPATAVHFYGPSQHQFIRVHTPATAPAPAPVAVIIHGGFWKSKFGVDTALIDSLAGDFSRRGWVSVEVEYRRVGHDGGGFPGTQEDCLSALGCLTEVGRTVPLDLNRVVVLGHSAGGQLALWAAEQVARSAEPAFVPALCVAIAPVTDLETGHEMRLSDEGDAVSNFMGCLPDSPENVAKYRSASPWWLLPNQVPMVLAVGADDPDVPATLVRDFAERAQAVDGGAGAELLVFPDCGHFEPVDATSAPWDALRAAIDRHVGGGSGVGPGPEEAKLGCA